MCGMVTTGVELSGTAMRLAATEADRAGLDVGAWVEMAIYTMAVRDLELPDDLVDLSSPAAGFPG